MLAALIYILDTVALISAFAIVKLTPTLIGASVGIIVFGFIFFGFLSFLGHRLMQTVTEDEDQARESTAADKTKGNENEAYVISDEKFNELNVDRRNEKNTSNAATVSPNVYTSTTYM